MNKLLLGIMIVMLSSLAAAGEMTTIDIVKEYKQNLLDLDRNNVDSISIALNKYKDMFKVIKDTTAQNVSYKLWSELADAIKDIQQNRLYDENELSSEILEKGGKIEDKLYESPEMQEKTREYMKTLERNGIDVYVTEGNPYLMLDLEYQKKHFFKYINGFEKDYINIRADEIKEGYTEGAAVIIPWDSIRKRIIRWENYAKKYPEKRIVDAANVFISEYLCMYISGNANSPLFDENKDFSKSTLLPAVKESYEAYLRNNKDSMYYRVIRDLYSLLSENGFRMNPAKYEALLKEYQLYSMGGIQPLIR
ncbi:MAG: hypothetical protein ABII64_00055 [Elusimicrobiota bacterium]